MILTSAVVLTALGLVVWLVGIFGNYQGLAAVGAILVVGVGAVVLSDGLERQSGEIERTINSSTTETIPQTTPIQLLPQTPTGAIWMLMGALLLFRGLNTNTT